MHVQAIVLHSAWYSLAELTLYPVHFIIINSLSRWFVLLQDWIQAYNFNCGESSFCKTAMIDSIIIDWIGSCELTEPMVS